MSGKCEYSRSNRENLVRPFQINLSKKLSNFRCKFFPFLVSTWVFQCSEKNNEPHRSRISEVINSEVCAYISVYQGLFLKTFSQWTCSLVAKTPKICRKILLTEHFFILSQIELGKANFNQIWYFRTPC